MANRRLSLVMAIIIVAFFPAILTGLIKMGSSWEGILMGGICLCVTLSVCTCFFCYQFSSFSLDEKLTVARCASCT